MSPAGSNSVMRARMDTPRGSENCLPVGTRLADFEVIEVLGEGGFGIVYLAFDHALRRTVAIKEFMPAVLAVRGADGTVAVRAERHHDAFQGGLKSFINEARMLAQFDHPALVKVHRYWEQNGTAYTAMQYYDGRTIKDIVGRSPELINQAWCLRMLGQVLQALEVLYTMQIVHRDVSPDNIIVQDTGEAVLLDFGSAREIIGDMTRAVTVILKPGYAPVEQYANDTSLEQGPYTDIYALCAVIYFAIARKAPASSIARMVVDPMIPLAKLAPPGYTQSFLAAIDRGLAVLAENRPRTIPAFRELLGIAPVVAPLVRQTGTTKRFPPTSVPDAAVPAAPVAPVVPAPPPAPVAKAKRAAPKPPAAPALAVVRTPKPARKGASVTVPPVPYTSPFAPEVQFTPTRSHIRARLLAGLALTAVLAVSFAMMNHQPEHHEEPSRISITRPHRTVVSAKDVAGTAEERTIVAPPVPTIPPLVTEQPLAVPAAAAPESAAAPDAVPAVVTVPLTLAIKPWGTVYIDGHERGASPPLKRLMLPAGTHEVRIVNPVYPAYTTTITLKKNGAAAIDHDFGVAPP